VFLLFKQYLNKIPTNTQVDKQQTSLRQQNEPNLLMRG